MDYTVTMYKIETINIIEYSGNYVVKTNMSIETTKKLQEPVGQITKDYCLRC